MNHYISKDDGKIATWQILEGMGYSIKHNDKLVEGVESVFDDIPAADVREVVLCRDCINRFMTPNGWRCHYVEWAIEDDDYCSCGERKDGAEMKGEADGT